MKILKRVNKLTMVFALLASTFLSNIPIKALTTQVSGDDIIAQAQSYSNWGYSQVGTCTGLVTRTLSDLGIARKIVGTMQGTMAQYSPDDMYANAKAHPEEAQFIWEGRVSDLRDFSHLLKNGDLVIQKTGDVMPYTGFGHVAFIHRYGSTISMYGANNESLGIGDLVLLTNARGTDITVNDYSMIRVFRLVDDTPLGNLKIAKKNEDNQYLPNTSFKISYNSDMSDSLGTYKTGSDGTVTIPDLNAQKVYIQEVSVPNPYVLDKTIKSITVVENDTVTYTATNLFKTGNLEVTKVDRDTGKVVEKAGNSFDVYKSDDTFVATISTAGNGIATLNNVRYGDYYVIEHTPAENYTQSTERIDFQVRNDKETISFEYSNKRTVGKINLFKCDSDLHCDINTGEGLGESQGDGSIDGAVYGLYAKENIVDPADNSIIFRKGASIKKNGVDVKLVIENGRASVNDLYLGLYTVKEETPGHLYMLDETEYTVDLGYTDPSVKEVTKVVTSHDTIVKQPFKIAKFTSNGSPSTAPALKGAEFTYILERYIAEYGSFENALKEAQKTNSAIHSSEWGVMVTDSEGVAVSKALPGGLYHVRETKVPNENVTPAKDFTVNIKENNPDKPLPYVYVNDTPFETVIAIVKQDAETNRTIALPGTTFKIKCLSDNLEFKEGEYVNWWLKYPSWGHISEFTTGEDGTVTLPNPLGAGMYQLEEITSPDGYLLAKTAQPFEISNNNIHQQVGPDDHTIITTLIFKDQPVKGQVSIDKQAEIFKGYESTDTEYGELFTPVYEKGMLPNVQFEIKAHTAIKGAEGTTYYRAGKTIETLTTDGTNITVSSLLPIGIDGYNVYSIREVKTEDGYVLDDTVRYFRFDYVDDETEVLSPTWLDENGNVIDKQEVITIENEKQSALVLTAKEIENSEMSDNTNAYKDVVFGCFAEVVDGLEQGALVGISKVNDDSSIDFNLSQSGEYYLSELDTENHLVLSDEKYPFTYVYTGDVVHEIVVNNGKPIYNYLKRGSIELFKTDEESANALINVQFDLATDPDMENIIKTTWTDENGRALFQELEVGYTYYIQEHYDGNHDMVSKGYVYDPTIHEVRLNEHEEVQVLNVTNKQVKGQVQFTKIGEMFNKVEIVDGKFGKEHHPIWEQGNLLGAELTVWAKEDIITFDGTHHYDKDQKVTVLESDWNMTDSLLLPVGKYYAKETKVPHGYVGSDTVYEFEVKPNGKAEIQLNGISIDNVRAKVNLDFTKVLEKQEVYINTEAYKDVVFGLYAREDIYNYMGKVAIENGSLIGISSIDENGHLTNTFDLPNGVYYFKELQTNDQYQLDTNEYDFEIGYQGADVKEYTVEINGGDPINNDLKRGEIEVIKTTKDSVHYTKAEQVFADSFHVMDDYARIYRNPLIKDEPNYLAGVTFELSTDETFTNIVDTKKTDGNGRIVFDNLELGTYYVREKSTLQHYVLNDEVFKVELTEHGQVKTIELENNLVKADIGLHKVDGTNHAIALQGAEFTMYADKECTEKLDEAITNQLGNAIFKDIKFGTTVYIKETKAPNGYELSNEVIKVTIDDEWMKKDIQNRVIEVMNYKIPTTPNTGDDTNMLMYIGMAGMALSVLMLAKKRLSNR